MRVTGPGVAPTGPRLAVDVWIDVMCPFCYLGDAAFGQALNDFPHRDRVDVRHRSFLLLPDVPVGEVVGLDDHLVVQRGVRRAQARAANADLVERAAALGLVLRADRVIVARTRTAHRLLQYAAAHGRQGPMVTRLFKAYFTDGLDVSDVRVLAGLAADADLDARAAAAVLESDAFEPELRADLRRAAELSVAGVPFFLFAGRYGVSGAQPVQVFRRALATAWDDAVIQAVTG